ncbi:hypothetical protein ACQCN2_14730 [Brevibacillus ginsengisoli]|uniref:hypothetical protein n=1 Tax=Brevibacillus ginsengisoli TaxID=363854 RepID=UPI003CE6B46F
MILYFLLFVMFLSSFIMMVIGVLPRPHKNMKPQLSLTACGLALLMFSVVLYVVKPSIF